MRTSKYVVTCLCLSISLGGAVAAPPALASSSWQVTTFAPKQGPASEGIISVAASSAHNAWALGSLIPNGKLGYDLVFRSHGSSWQAVNLPRKVSRRGQGAVYNWIGTTSPANVWLLGSGSTGVAAHWNGSRWSTTNLPGCCTVLIRTGAVLSSSDAWAFGGIVPRGGQSEHPYVARLRRGSWRQVRLPRTIANLPVGILADSAVSSTDIWALVQQSFASSTKAQLIHWNGRGWSHLRLPAALVTGFPVSVLATGPSSVWVGAQAPYGLSKDIEALWHWTPSGWVTYQIPSAVAASTQGAWPAASLARDGHGGLWVLGFEIDGGQFRIWNFGGGQWGGPQTVGSGPITIEGLVSVPRTSTVLGYGSETGVPPRDKLGVIAKYLP